MILFSMPVQTLADQADPTGELGIWCAMWRPYVLLTLMEERYRGY